MEKPQMVRFPSPAAQEPWHRQLDRDHWRIFSGSFFGRLLDGYETYALMLIVAPALRELLEPAQQSDLSRYAGIVMGLTLIGRAVGGVLTGIAADYLGRRRTLIGIILIYTISTGLTGLSQSWIQLALCRFLTGASLGGDLAAAATMLSESWPESARAKGQGLMQSAFAWGSLLAAAIWYGMEFVGGTEAWRGLFFVGVLPGLWVLYLRRGFRESSRWQQRHAERQQLRKQRRAGIELSSDETLLANFSLLSLFAEPQLRRKTLLCILLAVATTSGFWSASGWMPTHVESVSRLAHVANPARWASLAGLLFTVGAVTGYLSAAFLADLLGRRGLLLFFFAGSILSVSFMFLWAHSLALICAAAFLTGLFTLGQYSWISIYPPELFPTAVRATAIGVVFNVGRLFSALGPLFAGLLIARVGNYSTVAVLFSLIYLVAALAVPFLPETKGKPLPA
ncbi:MAG: MFS transporter [Acidobacteria bacterium]|nr:MFS transporter [Acidobacteriota bacterium]